MVGGVEHMTIPFHVSSGTVDVLRLSTAALRVQRSFICSWISESSVYTMRSSTSCAWDLLISALPPFRLDGVPGLSSSSGSYHTESGNICAVQDNVSSGKLVTKHP